MFVTPEGRPGARFRRAVERGNLTAAEQAAFELAFVSLADARALLELYAEKGGRKYERAALKYLGAFSTRPGRLWRTWRRSRLCWPSPVC